MQYERNLRYITKQHWCVLVRFLKILILRLYLLMFINNHPFHAYHSIFLYEDEYVFLNSLVSVSNISIPTLTDQLPNPKRAKLAACVRD